MLKVGIPLSPRYPPAPVNILRCFLLALVGLSFVACKSGKSKSDARIYEGDSTPGIRMHEESPGTPVSLQ